MKYPLVCICESHGVCKATGRYCGKTMHARCKVDERYRYVLSGIPRNQWPEHLRPPAPPVESTTPPAPAKAFTTERCIHLGGEVYPLADPTGAARRCAARVVRQCDAYGRCTLGVAYPGVACCAPAGSCRRYLNADMAAVLDEIAGPERARPNHAEWVRSPATKAAHIYAYRQFLDELPPYPDDRRGRGVLLVGGGPKYSPGLYLHVRLLRELGCELPVQIWHRGAAEAVPQLIRDLPGVTVVDADRHPSRGTWRAFGGWQMKLIAGLGCGWREWIYSDADNYPVADPTPCFDNPTGAVLFPDADFCDGNLIWSSYGVEPPRPNRGTNAGSAVFDLARCWRALQLAHHFDMHSEYWYKKELGVGGFGDQDQVRAAFVITGTPYTLYAERPDNRKNIFVQPGPDGRPLFVHRIADKPRPKLRRHDSSLPLESRVREILLDFGRLNR